MTEVIRIEPRAIAAWTVLAGCHRDLNEPLKALQLSIIGAHLRHDAEEWHKLAVQSRLFRISLYRPRLTFPTGI